MVVDFHWVKPGKGGAFIRTKMKNMLTGLVHDETFRSGEKLEEPDLEYHDMQYLYNDGDLYHFLDQESYEQVSFNNWHYGTSKEHFYKDNIFIMTPSGVSKIRPEDRVNTLVIFFDIPLSVRRERLMERSDTDKVDRRLAADEQDFANFTDYDLRITNSDF